MIPSDDDIKAAVTAALSHRQAAAGSPEFDTLVQFVRGRMRMAIDSLPLDQVAQKVTDLFLEGHRDMPPEGHRPQLRALVRSACTTVGAPVPPDAAVETLVNLAVGWMADQSLPTLPGGRAVVTHNIVGLYLAGA